MNISMILHVTIVLSIGFIALLIGLKIIGRRQVQPITPFDFISAIVLGEIVGNTIYDPETNFLYMIYGIFLWSLLLYFIEKITQKSQNIRRVIQGSPVILIEKGVINYNALKKERLDFNELLSLLRAKDIFSIKEIEYALLEPNGVITIIKKSQYSSISKEDLNISSKPATLNLALIVDGEIEENNLKLTGYDKDWLVKYLKKQNIKNLNEVLYAEWNNNEGIYIQKYINTTSLE